MSGAAAMIAVAPLLSHHSMLSASGYPSPSSSPGLLDSVSPDDRFYHFPCRDESLFLDIINELFHKYFPTH
jgi:hypothetical protein